MRDSSSAFATRTVQLYLSTTHYYNNAPNCELVFTRTPFFVMLPLQRVQYYTDAYTPMPYKQTF